MTEIRSSHVHKGVLLQSDLGFRYIPVRGERSYVFVLPSFRSSRPRRKCMTLYPNSQRHLHIHGLLFILPAIAVGLPPVCIPYHRFEMPCCIEISNTDSTSYHLGLTLSNHRLADRLGSCGVLLICIFLRASHRLLLMFPRMSDLPYRLWGQPIAIFLALHLALRGAHESQHLSALLSCVVEHQPYQTGGLCLKGGDF